MPKRETGRKRPRRERGSLNPATFSTVHSSWPSEYRRDTGKAPGAPVIGPPFGPDRRIDIGPIASVVTMTPP